MPLPTDLENRTQTATAAVRLDEPPRGRESRPEHYFPDPGLVDAIRVALLLRKPLLLTGSPGTGKTELGSYLSWKLDPESRPLIFEAKSTSSAKDLFYTYNTLGRFHSIYTQQTEVQDVDFLTYSALGEAIVQASPLEDLEGVLPRGFEHRGPKQSLVLIDEIDKAPRDFPNDVLNEVEKNYFRLVEFRNRQIKAKKGYEPVLVITSNSEKSLPAPFLRRCIYYHIPLPTESDLQRVLRAKLVDNGAQNSPLINDAVAFLLILQKEDSNLQKPPATAELIDWVTYLIAMRADPGQRLSSILSLAESGIGTLVKHNEDQQRARDLLRAFAK